MSSDVFDIYPDEDLEPQLGLLLAVLEDASTVWRHHLSDVTVDAIVWQPEPGGHSIGAILLHMAYVELSWIRVVAAGETLSRDQVSTLMADDTRVADVVWPTPPSKPLSWYFEQLDLARAETRRVLKSLNDPDHVGQRKNHSFTLRWIVNHVISHDAYHGGQCVLLNLMYQKSHR
jgi:uncharacterized damage-inducible protein DinB